MKSAVIYGLCISVFVVFMLFSKAPSPEHKMFRRGRKMMRVKLHKASAEANPRLEHIPFDPVVAEWEEKEEDRLWERAFHKDHHDDWLEMKQHEAEEYVSEEGEDVTIDEPDEHEWEEEEHEFQKEADEYFNPDHFNITNRLIQLFPQIDVNPSDGLITVEELTHWQVEQGERSNYHRTDREMEAVDKNHDGLVTLKEYLHDNTSGKELKTDWDEHQLDWVEKSKVTFPMADLDGDGYLNRHEFNDFLHPEDSSNPKLLAHLRQEEMHDRDLNKDGRMDWEEFLKTTFDELRDFVSSDGHHNNTEERIRKSHAKFAELDKNRDGFLSVDELEPIMEKLQPGEKYYAKQQAEHMVQSADSNGDGKLTVVEMVQNPYVFYNAAYEDDHDDDVDDDDDEDDVDLDDEGDHHRHHYEVDYDHEDFR